MYKYTHPKFDFKQCAAVLSRSCSKSLLTLVLRKGAVRYSPATNQGVSGRMSTYQSQVSRSDYCPWQVTTSPVIFKKGTCHAESSNAAIFANKSILFIPVHLRRVYHGSTSTDNAPPQTSQQQVATRRPWPFRRLG